VKLKESSWVLVGLSIFGLVAGYFFVRSSGSYQMGDTYLHYAIARWAWNHPCLLLDHWGKPVFTALYALPALGGYTTAKVFTLVIGLITGWVTFKVARDMGIGMPFTAPMLLLGSPLYFIHLNSTMTETTFALFIILGVMLVGRQRFVAAALVLSLLPFVRSEGFVLLPFMSVWLLYRRQWLAFLLLGSGFVCFSLLGALFCHHNILWVFAKNPYAWVSTYGSGPLLHFVLSNKIVWGILFSILLLLALALYVFSLIRKNTRSAQGFYTWMVVAPALVFLVFHSVVWWTGRMASAGETRVLVSVMPLYALMGARALAWLHSLSHRYMRWPVIACALIITVTPWAVFDLPLAPARDQKLIIKASNFVRENFPDEKIWFIDPYIPIVLERDFYDTTMTHQWFWHPANPHIGMKEGDITIWDGHFCPREGRTKLTSFTESPYFETLLELRPEKPFTVYGVPYEVYVFRRTAIGATE
jgi:hypothetical protein